MCVCVCGDCCLQRGSGGGAEGTQAKETLQRGEVPVIVRRRSPGEVPAASAVTPSKFDPIFTVGAGFGQQLKTKEIKCETCHNIS